MTTALHPRGAGIGFLDARPAVYAHTPASLRLELDRLHVAYATTAADLDNIRPAPASLFGRSGGKHWIFERVG